MRLREFLGVLLIVIVISVGLLSLFEVLTREKKSTEGVCKECGHKHSMENRTEDTAVYVGTYHEFYDFFERITCIKYKCESCKLSTDIKWSVYTTPYYEGKVVPAENVITTFVKTSEGLVPRYEEKKSG